MEVRTRHLFTLNNEGRDTNPIGGMAYGERTALVNIRGSFRGDRLGGSLLSGTDWLTLLPDDVLMLDCHMVLQTDDKKIIGMHYRGIRHGPTEAGERLARGEHIDATTYSIAWRYPSKLRLLNMRGSTA